MKFFSFLVAVFLASALSASDKMNVLFISADDLNCDMSTYGNPQVKTPNLDRLANMGVRFDRAYCQQPLCGPSRASVMTGLRPNKTGFNDNRHQLRDLVPNVETLGQFFQKKGYYSGRVGKIYHYHNPKHIGTDGDDDLPTWTERFNPIGIDRSQEENITIENTGAAAEKRSMGISMAWWDPVSEDEDHTDGKVATQAIKMIEKNKNKPFFIAAGFFNPHCPYVAPKKYFDLYDINDITMETLESAKEDLKDVPAMATFRDSKNWPYFFPGVSHDGAKRCKLAYYATISFLDAQIGRILDALEKNNLMEKTIIVFWSDHGYFLGEKGLWYKRKAFELSARVPLIVSVPGVTQGKPCSRTVELVDLYPTLVDHAGFDVPKGLDGVSLRPLLTNPETTWDRPAITQVHYAKDKQGYSIRSERWRYTEWNGGKAGKELYDHDNDPQEKTNLANRTEYAEIMKDLSGKMVNYQDSYKYVQPPPHEWQLKKKNKKKK